MSDLFHTGVNAAYVDRVFDVMEEASHHTFQVLTKRSGRMQKYLRARYRDTRPPENIWMGVSVEDNPRRVRIRHLQGAPVAVRFLSLEPLLEPLPELDLEAIHWVIVGGESGPGARGMNGEWVREIRDECLRQEVPFFFKQWGGRTPKANGRTLDGRTYDSKPGVANGSLEIPMG